MLTAIWAQDKTGLIGKDGRLPWYLPADLKFFKETTVGQTIVMGRKTFEGMGKRPLPNRQTIVLTRDKAYQSEGILVLHTIEDVLAYAEQQATPVFITGGAMIYQDFLPYCQQLYRTVIEESFEGDTYFPEVDWEQWMLSETDEGIIDEKNRHPYRFENYLRK
ncbi:dihydrofolate reductase [Enterococcus olivae]